MSPTATQPLVYFFGQGRADGSAAMKDILGGKGAALAEMTSIGVSVPPGFTIASTLCQTYLQTRAFPGGLRAQVEACLNRLEAATRRQFGGATKPLLVSVRSGAALSMPGMMETILNLGLNDATVVALERESGNPQFAWDSYRRFVQMYAAVVYSVPKERFETLLAERKRAQSVTRDIDLPVDDLKALVGEFKGLIERETGHGFPDDPMDQLWGAIAAVFESWNTKRAIDYRTLHDIPDSLGTAVNVMTMVFGNLGEDCGTGVAFTRDPSTGENVLYGEFLLNAQGEDVVSGTRDPQPIAALAETLPEAHAELVQMAKRLERHFREPNGWSDISGTYRTWNSPSSVVRSTCSRLGGRSAPATQRCASPATWSTKDRSPRKKRSRGSRQTISTSSSTRRSIRQLTWIS
jgi:pyruvate,orthophosphate dikinase